MCWLLRLEFIAFYFLWLFFSLLWYDSLINYKNKFRNNDEKTHIGMRSIDKATMACAAHPPPLCPACKPLLRRRRPHHAYWWYAVCCGLISTAQTHLDGLFIVTRRGVNCQIFFVDTRALRFCIPDPGILHNFPADPFIIGWIQWWI